MGHSFLAQAKEGAVGHRLLLTSVIVALALVALAVAGMCIPTASAEAIEVPTTLSIGGGDNSTISNYFGLTTVGWIVAAGAIICLLAVILLRDLRILILDAVLWIALIVMMYY
jgi:hypothetical protein